MVAVFGIYMSKPKISFAVLPMMASFRMLSTTRRILAITVVVVLVHAVDKLWQNG